MKTARYVPLLLLLLPLSAAAGHEGPRAAPDANAERQAAALLQEAEEAFSEGRHELALELFVAAFETHPDPRLHARMGVCRQKLGDHEKAAESFERYLAELPRAPDRGEVERRLAESRAAAEASFVPLVSLVPPGADEEGEDEPASEAGEPELPAGEEAASTTPAWAAVTPDPKSAQPAERRAIYERWWFWAAIGVTAVAGGGAAYAGSRQDPVTVLPSGSLGSVDWR